MGNSRIGYGTPPIVTEGLVLLLDAANPKSYVSGSTTVNDLSGYRNNGTLVNGVGFNTSNSGVFTFDGTNDYVDTNFIMPKTEFTVTIIFKLNNFWGWKVLWGSDVWFSSLGYLAYFQSTTSLVFRRSNSDTISGTVPNVFNYNHYTFVKKSNGDSNIYLNGVNIASGFISESQDITKTIKLATRHSNDGSGFTDISNCNIPMFNIYNRALSQDEITQNYNSLKSRFGL